MSPETNKDEDYGGDEYGEESSAITEIVEEKVINIESEDEMYLNDENRDQHIDEYLKMDDKDEYVNKDEYQNVEGINSEDDRMKYEEEQEGIHPSPEQILAQDEIPEGTPLPENEEDEELEHAGLQTNFIEGESKHILHYSKEGFEPEIAEIDVQIENGLLGEYIDANYGNSPIQENDAEEYSTPQDGLLYADHLLDERTHLFQIANEVKKKDQSRKFVLWETNEMRNLWDDKLYTNTKHAISQKKLEHHWNNDIERKVNSQQAKAQAYDYSNIEEQNLPVHKSKQFYDFQDSKVPLLSDHAKALARRKGTMVETGNSFQNVPKKDHQLNNIFLQSELQGQLNAKNKNLNRQKPPHSHQSLSKKHDFKNDYASKHLLLGYIFRNLSFKYSFL
jgi:hypothetical protein